MKENNSNLRRKMDLVKYLDFMPKKNVNNATVDILTYFINESESKNIGVIGNYGSGKSSIILSYLEKTEKNNIVVSLASFKPVDPTEKNSVSNPIEIGILQQLFLSDRFKVATKDMFWSIKSFLVLVIILLLTFLISGIYNFDFVFTPITYYKEIISNFFNVKYASILLYLFSVSTYVVFLAFLTVCLTYLSSMYVLSSVKLKKFEISLKEKKSTQTSIISSNIKNIIRLFSHFNIEIVVFEDLDRFGNDWIFVKLRELNNILNNSSKLRNNVKFVYSVKDELFSEKIEDRTKFFDVIVPVIPVVTTVNSHEKMDIFLNTLPIEFRPRKNIVRGLMGFIFDLRMAINIFNEYVLYLKNLNETAVVVNDNLFAFMVYKNVYPKDFTDLQRDLGLFYSILSHKNEFDTFNINSINDEILGYNHMIEEIEQEKGNIKDLRRVTILRFLNDYIGEGQIKVNNSKFNMESYLEDSQFEALLGKSFQYTQGYNSYTIGTLSDFLTRDTEYHKRLDNINNHNKKKITSLRKAIQELERSKVILTCSPLKTKLIRQVDFFELKKMIYDITNSDKSKNIDIENYIKENNYQLLVYIIAQGLLGEDYTNYISYFYEGSRTSDDVRFEKSVVLNEKLSPDLILTGMNDIFNSLSSIEYYSSDSILNIMYIDFICTLEENDVYIKEIIDNIRRKFDQNITFLEKYLLSSKQHNLLKYFVVYWKDFFKDFSEISKNDQILTLCFIELISNLSFQNIKTMIKNDEVLFSYISEITEFSIFTEVNISKIIEIANCSNIRFKHIDNTISTEDFNFLIDNNLLEINEYNIDVVLGGEMSSNYGKVTQLFEHDLENIRIFFESNVEDIIINVFIHRTDNRFESDSLINYILHTSTIESDIKSKFIKSLHNKVIDYSDLSNDLIKELLKNVAIEPSWTMLYFCFINESIDEDDIINYISNSYVYNKLSNEKEKLITPLNEDFLKFIFENISSSEAAMKLVDSVDFLFDNISLIDDNVLDILLKNSKVEFSADIFDDIIVKKLNGTNDYINSYIDETIDNYDSINYVFTINDMKRFLKSASFSNKNKELLFDLFIEKCEDDELIEFRKLFENLSLAEYFNYLESFDNVNLRINIILSKSVTLRKTQLLKSLKLLPYPFSHLVNRSVGLSFEKSRLYSEFFDYLEEAFIVYRIEDTKSKLVVNTKSEKYINKEHITCNKL